MSSFDPKAPFVPMFITTSLTLVSTGCFETAVFNHLTPIPPFHKFSSDPVVPNIVRVLDLLNMFGVQESPMMMLAPSLLASFRLIKDLKLCI